MGPAGSSRSGGPVVASRWKSATAGGSTGRGGATRSRATTSRSLGRTGWPSSISTGSTGPGTSSGSTTEDRAVRRFLAERPPRSAVARVTERQADDEQDREDPRHEDQRAQIPWLRGLQGRVPIWVTGTRSVAASVAATHAI